MPTAWRQLFVAFLATILLAGNALLEAQTVYVVPPGTPGHTPASPYNSWGTAATNIQTAITTADAQGWTNVVVSNGTYEITSQITITTGIYLRSWNDGGLDRDGTIVQNTAGPSTTTRCFNINHADAVLDGFLIRDGNMSGGGAANYGGGIYLAAGTVRNSVIANCTAVGHAGGINVLADGTVEDCIIAENICAANGGGVLLNGGTMRRVNIHNNTASTYAGGMYMDNGAQIYDSIVASNACGSWGAGIFASAAGIVSNITIFGNNSGANGGGIYLSVGANDAIIADRCVIYNNTAVDNGGGGYLNGGTLRNSLIYNNSANNGGGLFINTYNKIYNCTVVSNSATSNGGGIRGSSSFNENYLHNTIVYYNHGPTSNHNYAAYLSWSNCCTAPLSGVTNGTGNISNAPLFVDMANNNFRLADSSPCLNAGAYQGWMDDAIDLDGFPRITYGQVDIGCYEYPYAELTVTPLGQTNVVIEGGATSGVFTLQSDWHSELYPDAPILHWSAHPSVAWITLGVTNGSFVADASDTLVWTNDARTLSAQRHVGTVPFTVTNIYGALPVSSSGTDVASLTLDVAGLRVSSTVITNTTLMGFDAVPKTLEVWADGAGELAWAATVSDSGTNWLRVEPSSDVCVGAPVPVTNAVGLVFVSSNLALGDYFAQVYFTPVLGGSSRVIEVRLSVNEPGGLSMAPISFTAESKQGEAPPADLLVLTNVSAYYQAHYGVSVTDGAGWLNVTGATNGILAPGASASITLDYHSSTGLLAGLHHGMLSVTSAVVDADTGDVLAGLPRALPVMLRVKPLPELSVSATLITNRVSVGRDAGRKIFQVWNGSGFYTLNYQISDNAPWLIPSVQEGSSAGERNVIELEYSTAALSVGSYTGTLTVTASSPVTGADVHHIALFLEVTDLARLQSDGASQSYHLRQGAAEQVYSFDIKNITSDLHGAPLRWQGSVIYWDNASHGLLSFSPSSGVVPAGGSQPLTLRCHPAGLPPGSYEGLLRVTGYDAVTGDAAPGSPYDVRVRLQLEPGDDLSFGAQPGSALVVYSDNTGVWGLRNLSGAQYFDWLGAPGCVPVPGDYNGDGYADLAVYRPSSGGWYCKEFGSDRIVMLGNFGGPDWVPVRGDYDGDGCLDFVLYHELSGAWYGLLSGSGYAVAGAVLGGPGFMPVAGDFDGDGKSDPAVYRRATGEWRGLFSSVNYALAGGIFGNADCVPVAGDFDGDGRSDLCVYHSAGYWFIMRVDGRVLLRGARWGGSPWLPVSGDYDGDGKDDLALYHPYHGTWHIARLDGAQLTVIAQDIHWGGYNWQAVGR